METQSPNKPAARNRRWLAVAFYLIVILCVAFGFIALKWIDTMPARVDEQQTLVLGQTRFIPNSDASLRVVVQDFGQGKPIAGAQVKVSLRPDAGQTIPLYEGQTDDTGSLPVQFHVPADAPDNVKLVVETRSAAGHDQVEQPVTIQRDYRLLLTSDKPLYQPGQVIHMRTLALSAFDLTPARGATIDFLVEDSKGNKVFRKSVAASDYGIAAADFTLADLVNQGNYKLSVAIGGESEQTRSQAEKTVEVRPYVLPKFGLTVSTERSFYLPGQRVQGTLQADYFFGNPVAGGQVQIVGSVWQVQRVELLDLRGQTDDNGAFAFAFDLPDYFAGSGLESGQAQFALEVTVIDQANHAEQISQILPISAQPLIIEAVAESGQLKPGVENIVYILTSYPDGRPAPARLQIGVNGGSPTELTSGEFGLAQFTFVPQAGSPHQLNITASDETGLSAARKIDFQTEGSSDSVLLRADRAAYVVGETMNLTAFTPVGSGSIYLDIVKSGQMLSTRSAQVAGGKAEFAIDASPDLYGTLELHAYKVLLDGTIVRDTRVVVVDAPNDIAIGITADKDTYLPGDMATINFKTTDAKQTGAGVQAALGVAIVDESVFALQRQDPGFAKLYFMLEQELLEPFYQIKGFELPAAIPDEAVRLAQDDAAKATWAGTALQAALQPVNSRQLKMAAVDTAQRRDYVRIGSAAAIGMILVPLALWAVVIVALWKSGVIKRSLVRLAIASAILLFAVCLLTGSLILGRGNFYPGMETILLLLAGVLGLGMLVFVGYAWVKGNPADKLFSLITLAWPVFLYLLILVSNRKGEPDEALIIVGLAAYLLIPGAYLLFGQMRWSQQRIFAGIVTTVVGSIMAFPAIAILPLLLIGAGGGAVAPMMGAPVMSLGMPTPEPLALEKGRTDTDQAASTDAPRLRQYFPETLFWAPEIVTDKEGAASLQIAMADSITTWRLTALASSQDGRLGFTTRGIRVFQDFFVDIDLPVALTQDDEISLPVAVYNYLPQPQQVRLVVQPEPWFELTGEAEQTLTIASNDVEVVYFPIRVLKFGRQGFQVTAWGEKMSDAIRREVNVAPNGKEMLTTESDWLRENKELSVRFPPQAVPETAYVEVKIYPGVMAQVVEGLEKILRLPYG